MKTNDEIKKFLSGLKTNVDILYYVDVEKIDAENAFDSISEMIEENGGFDKEVIYLNNAINFLAENDPSLQDSLELAEEFGYSAKELNSEILASLLASKIEREKFEELRHEIETFFEQ
jgi:GTPase involved in cell partitioning and DNA repair